MKIPPFLERAAIPVFAVAAGIPALGWLLAPSMPPLVAVLVSRSASCERRMADAYGRGLCESGIDLQTALFSLLVLAAAAIAVALQRGKLAPPLARGLARGLCLGAAALSYALFVAPAVAANGAGLALRSALHGLTLLAASRCFADVYAFLRNFPIRVALEDGDERDGVTPGRWPKLRRVNARLLRAFDEPGVLFHLLVFAGIMDLALFAMSRGAIGGFFLLFAAMGATLEAISAMTFNVRHLREEDRRQEWLFLGIWLVAIGYLIVPAAVIALSVGVALATGELAGTAAQAMPTDPVELFTNWAAIAIVMANEPLALLAVLVLLAISFFYHGSLDPRLAIRQATVVSLIVAAGGILFVLAERYVVHAIVGWLGLPSDSGWIVAGVVAGGVIVPARRLADGGVRAFIDRLTPATELANGEPMDAAVVFSDLSGFTALSARDERAGIIAASLLHKVAREVARENGGRLVKTAGDAALLEFASADDAVRATRALHGRYALGSSTLGLPALAVHSGIHAGKFVRAHDGDVYGSTVNLAARLQDAARAGEIVVSGEVRRRVTEGAFRWDDLGARDFKNVPESVPILRLAE